MSENTTAFFYIWCITYTSLSFIMYVASWLSWSWSAKITCPRTSDQIWATHSHSLCSQACHTIPVTLTPNHQLKASDYDIIKIYSLSLLQNLAVCMAQHELQVPPINSVPGVNARGTTSYMPQSGDRSWLLNIVPGVNFEDVDSFDGTTWNELGSRLYIQKIQILNMSDCSNTGKTFNL